MVKYQKKNEPLRNVTNTQKSAHNPKSSLNAEEMLMLNSQLIQDRDELCMVSKYTEEIFTYYRFLDTKHTYANITPYTDRNLMIDWIIGIQNRLSLSQDTLYLTVHIIDKFLTKKKIPSNKLTLVGVTALMIACKFEEVVCPTLKNLIVLGSNFFTEDDIKKAERYMLFALDYDGLFCNPLNFLRRCSKANNYEKKSRAIAKYILELSLIYTDLNKYTGSVKAAAAMYLARKITKQDLCKNLFVYYSGHSKEEIKDCFDTYVIVLAQGVKYENIVRKYDTQKYEFASARVSDYVRQHFY